MACNGTCGNQASRYSKRKVTYVVVRHGLLLLCLLVTRSAMSAGFDLYFIDAHSQADPSVAMDLIVDKMSQSGVKQTLLAPRRGLKWQVIQSWSKARPAEIKPLAKSKGKHYRNGSRKFYDKFRRQLDRGSFVGMGEILVFHREKRSGSPEVKVRLDDPRILFLLGQAARHGWPVFLHIEFASLRDDERTEFMNDLVSFLDLHSDQPFVMMHMAQLPADKVAELIESHGNIYFATSHADPVHVGDSIEPWVNMFRADGNGLTGPWKSLLKQYPERFVFALDNVWLAHWNVYEQKVALWRKALSEFPRDVAEKVAHGNAESLWGLGSAAP